MVIVRIWEGLGNQLFQYAFARSLVEKGYDVSLDLDKAYDSVFLKYKNNDTRNNTIEIFNITIESIDVDDYGRYRFVLRNSIKRKMFFILSKYKLWKYCFIENQYQHFLPDNEHLPKECYIKGWFQSEKYFKNIRNILLEELSLKKSFVFPEGIRKVLDNKAITPIAVHVRRGDYVRIGLALSHSYYKKAIHYIKNMCDNPYFVFFSEDSEWVKSKLEVWGCDETNSMICYGEGLADYEELVLMSKFRANIISNSTFSWWSAYLNQNIDKIVVAPNEKYWLRGQKGIIPEGWVTI